MKDMIRRYMTPSAHVAELLESLLIYVPWTREQDDRFRRAHAVKYRSELRAEPSRTLSPLQAVAVFERLTDSAEQRSGVTKGALLGRRQVVEDIHEKPLCRNVVDAQLLSGKIGEADAHASSIRVVGSASDEPVRFHRSDEVADRWASQPQLTSERCGALPLVRKESPQDLDLCVGQGFEPRAGAGGVEQHAPEGANLLAEMAGNIGETGCAVGIVHRARLLSLNLGLQQTHFWVIMES